MYIYIHVCTVSSITQHFRVSRGPYCVPKQCVRCPGWRGPGFHGGCSPPGFRETRGVTTTSPLQLVDAAIDAVLAAHDPATTPDVELRGARYDAGLAWVHFPVGFGGLGLRPDLNRHIDRRFRDGLRGDRGVRFRSLLYGSLFGNCFADNECIRECQQVKRKPNPRLARLR